MGSIHGQEPEPLKYLESEISSIYKQRITITKIGIIMFKKLRTNNQPEYLFKIIKN